MATPTRRSLRLLLDRDSYAPGETVRGTVELLLPKPLRTRGIRVYLVGTEETEITVSRGSGRNRTSTTYRSQSGILSRGFVLFGGQPVGMMKALGEAIESLTHSLVYPLLPAGRHEYPFEFELPDDALPTWSGTHATVAYSIRAEVDVPVGPDLRFNGGLYVIPPESWTIAPGRRAERHVPGGLLASLQADVSTDFEFNGCPLGWKERLEGRLLVRNRSSKKIRGATISLLSVEHAEARGCVRNTTSVVLTGFFKTPDPAAAAHDITFGFVLDPSLAPYQGSNSRVVYWLQAELDIKFAGDPMIQVPLEIV